MYRWTSFDKIPDQEGSRDVGPLNTSRVTRAVYSRDNRPLDKARSMSASKEPSVA